MIGGTGPQLAPAQQRTIRAILDAHWESWMCEETPQPCESNVYDAASPSPPPSLAVVMPRNIENDPAYIEHDISFHMTRTARTAGFETTFFAADAITYSGSEGYHDEFTKLVSFLEAGKPNIVAIDGNYRPNKPATIFTFKRALSPDDMAKLRLQFGFQLIVVIPDCHDLAPDYLSVWGPVADLVVTFHKDSEFNILTILSNLCERRSYFYTFWVEICDHRDKRPPEVSSWILENPLHGQKFYL
jgi:hypothetical protein